MLLLLIVINILSYVDRHMLPAFASQITADLELTRQQFGLLTGFAFVTVYALSGPLMGVMADRFNPSKVIAAGILLWSLMTYLTGLSKSFVSILLPRMAIGVGEAVLHPSAAGILGKLFSSGQRATVFGLFFMGSQIGMGLAYWLAGTFGEQIGWRQMFYILGGLGVLLCALLLPFARLTRHAPLTVDSPHGLQGQSVRSVLGELWGACTGNRNFRWAVIGMSIVHMLYASTRALFVAIVILLSAPLLILFRLSSPDNPLFYVGMSASVFMLAFPCGAMFSLVLDFAPKNIQSTAAGFTMFIANVLVIGTGTFAIGFFADVFEAQAFAVPLTTALLGSDVIAILAALIYFNLHRSSRRPL